MLGKVYFTTLDAVAEFHQIPLGDVSKRKTAFFTWARYFQWTPLLFESNEAPADFQHTKYYILLGFIFLCALVYMDDIIVYWKNFEDHMIHLQLVFDRLLMHKCQLWLTKFFLNQSILFIVSAMSTAGKRSNNISTSLCKAIAIYS